jgi:hypothetical protein
MLRLAATLLVFAALAACAPMREWTAMQMLRDDFTDYHRCVPLGWNVEPVASTYVVGTSVEFEPNGWWLKPLWIGIVYDDQMRRRDVREAVALLDALAAHGLVQDSRLRHFRGTRFNLTMAGMEYYFDRNRFGNNPLRESYLCYSKLVPDQVLALDKNTITFHWHESTPAPWAQDPIIQAHSVVLAPQQDPVEIRISEAGSTMWINGVVDQTDDVAVSPATWKR